MFDTLSDRLGKVFDQLTGKAIISEGDVDVAMGEVRRALIEADVALSVVKSFIKKVKDEAVGQEVYKSVTPGQMIIKIVNDILIELLGSEVSELNFNAPSPIFMMMVGLQGSGKTTSTAKLALRITNENKKKVLMVSLDTRRPAAQEQLKILGEQIGVDSLPIVDGQPATEITKRAINVAKLNGYDVVLLDTAGRMHVDDSLMQEVVNIDKIAKSIEKLLVVDSLTGQDAVNVAENFGARLDLSGVILTRVDGDARGGAALSMRNVTGKPVKFVGVGEKVEDLEKFNPERVAGRILGMGDVVSLVEKASETMEAEKAQRIAKKMAKGHFDLDDLAEQLKQMEKIGGMSGILAMLPGAKKIKSQLNSANLDDKIIKHQEAIISSMTKAERKNPRLLNASRKRRIAAGSGTDVQRINKLLKLHRQMADMMKKMGKMGALKGMFGGNPLAAMGDASAAGKEADIGSMLGGADLGQLPNNLLGGQQLPGNLTPDFFKKQLKK